MCEFPSVRVRDLSILHIKVYPSEFRVLSNFEDEILF